MKGRTTGAGPQTPTTTLRTPLSLGTPLILTLILLSLTTTTTTVSAAWPHQPYNDRMVAAAHMAAAAAHRDSASRATEGAHQQQSNAYHYSPGAESAWGAAEDDRERLLRQLFEVEPSRLREVILQSVGSLRGEGEGHSKCNSGGGEERCVGVGEAVKETPEEYHTCLNHTAETVIALAERQRWAWLMVDAMGKPTPAISEGNLLWVGAYELCNNIRANTSLVSHPFFSGKYCNAYAQIPLKTPNALQAVGILALGLCVPDTCSEFDMTVLLNDVLNRLGVKIQVGVQCPPVSTPLDAKATVALVICSILLLCIVVGTAADVFFQEMEKRSAVSPYVSANGHGHHQEEHMPLIIKTQTPPPYRPGVLLKVLICFSVYTNGSKLLSTSQPAGSLTCVHGIRFLSMTWVVLGHGFLFPMSVGENTAPFLQQSLNRWTFQGIANALVSVDSFFVLSGLLVSYLTLKELQKKNGRLNWFLFYFHRFWRLTPAYMLVIMVYVCLSRYWGSGPIWPAVNADRDNCEKYWWTNLLYINNVVDTEKMCLGQSWYLANDMQFYCILSPLVIIPLFYKPIAGYIVSGVLVLAHCVFNAALTMHYVYPPGMFVQLKTNSPPDMADWGPNFYMKPYTRWGPYVIGMLAGYFLYVTKCKLNVRWHVNSVLWGAATAAALAVLYGLYGASTGDPMTLGLSAFYNAMHRNVWAVCLSWVIIACVTGNGGFVNTILSWPGFIPLSRLTYCIYLLHILIMDIYLFNMRSLFYFSDVNLVMFFLSVLVVSYMAAAVASLAFEAPMMALEKLILSRDRSRGDNRQHYHYQQQQQQGQQQYQEQQEQNGGVHVNKD